MGNDNNVGIINTFIDIIRPIYFMLNTVRSCMEPLKYFPVYYPLRPAILYTPQLKSEF